MIHALSLSNLNIAIDGHETMTGTDDPIIYIEYSEMSECHMLYVWADINQEDPTHIIPLQKAEKRYRRERDEDQSLGDQAVQE